MTTSAVTGRSTFLPKTPNCPLPKGSSLEAGGFRPRGKVWAAIGFNPEERLFGCLSAALEDVKSSVSETSMSRPFTVSLLLAVVLLLSPVAPFLPAEPNHGRTVWNYDGGLQMMTDGSIPSGPCFRVVGRATAPDYFENLKRVDTNTGTLIHRGNDIVTEFPNQLHLSFLLYDFPCDLQFQSSGGVTYLTKAVVSTLRLSFYWKHGLTMRPAKGIVPRHFETHSMIPYAIALAEELPQRYEWEFEFDLPSAGVPVTDSLVLILRTPDGHIAARAAARM
jgi:hypothetical protein